MINFALKHCDFLTVLVCCSDKENVSGALRKQWIEKTFEKEKNIEVRTFDYLESELPNTSETSVAVSKIWADIFKKQLPDYSLLITSEEYGYLVSEFMDIRHLPFDIPKNHFPVSATAIRKDVFKNWEYVPDSVKPYYSLKVALLGTECTGKTTLTKKLAKHFNCSAVLEAGRDLIADSNTLTINELYLVAREHANRIDQANLSWSPLLIIDTDIHTTKSYSRFTFQKELEISAAIYESNRANLFLYLNNDVKYVQDGTRLTETNRNLLDLSHRQVLADHKIDFIEITGNWDERFEKVVKHINELIHFRSARVV